MKVVNTIAKILVALAAVAGAVYVIATYGEKIVAWAKNLLNCCSCCCNCECDCDCDCECECECECGCGDECECECECTEEAPTAVEAVVEDAIVAEADAIVADEADFEA